MVLINESVSNPLVKDNNFNHKQAIERLDEILIKM